MARPFTFAVGVFLIATLAQAREMKLTIYDDGVSCPNDCDAHVVINRADNGTRYARRPGSSRASPTACVPDEDCIICFGDADASCMTVKYRGGGPPRGTFDFTPAFYEANCAHRDIPVELRNQCRTLDNAADRLGYNKAINCFAIADHPKCSAVLAAARAAKEADIPKRQKCLEEGQQLFNQAQTDPKERRIDSCNYSELMLGGSATKHWHLLLPAACREGTYVDRFGLDCCSADIRFAASNHPECAAFFPH